MGRVRAAKSKVRTGCRTCKLRRVKCDEGKPECHRCTSTGRECGGYEIIAPKAVSTGCPPKYILPGKPPIAPGAGGGNMLAMPSVIPGASVDETNYFGFFCRYTAPTISGAFSSPFFERFVLQLAVREPLVRHAATALGALQRAQERNEKVTLGQEEAGFALRQYVKAINLAREKLLAPDVASQRLELVACVLFVCFEIAQKRFWETAMHLEHGMNLLVNIRYKGNLPADWDTENFDSSDDGAALDREIARTFDRLDIQSTFVRSTRPKLGTDPYAIAQKTPRRFTSLEQAREYLNVLTRSISTFRHEVRATLSPFCFEDEQRLKTQQMQIGHQMRAWNAAFGSLRLPQVPLPTGAPLPADVSARAVLEATAVSANILLETGVADGSECIFDNFITDFKLIVDLGQIVKDHPRNPPSSFLPNGGASFHVHMGIIPTVYIVALKCRDPVIRRRALQLLETFPFREGMWDAPVGASLCRHVMDVEEEGYGNLRAAQDLPEKARIHEAMFDIIDYDGGIPVYYKRRDFEGEYGRAGSWLHWTGRARVAKTGFEEPESVWKCAERYHYIQSGSGRCLGCGRLAEEVHALGEEIAWNTCHWENDAGRGGAAGDGGEGGVPFDDGYASSGNGSPASPDSGPPGRGPPDMLLPQPRPSSTNTFRSHHSGGNDLLSPAFDPAEFQRFGASLASPPPGLNMTC